LYAKNDEMSRNAPTRIILAVLIGSTTEFYDFVIYSTAAALVFGRVFFPHLSSVNGLLAAFSVYAVGFLGRPTGAMLFGHLGDRVGRKRVLIASLLLMGLSTTAVGLLPSYAEWGVWAPITLTVLRFLQGVGLGGEFGGASLLAIEHAPPDRRGRYGAYVQLGPCLGFAVATGLFWALSSFLPEPDFMGWGWRLPFLASVGLVILGLVARIGIEESPAFLASAAARAADPIGAAADRAPLATVLRQYLRPLLLGAGTVVSGSVFFYIATTWALSHATNDLHMPRTRMLAMLLVADLVLGGATYTGALLSDRYGRPLVIRWGMVAADPAARHRPTVAGTARPGRGDGRARADARAGPGVPAGALSGRSALLRIVRLLQPGLAHRRGTGPADRDQTDRDHRLLRGRLVPDGGLLRLAALPAGAGKIREAGGTGRTAGGHARSDFVFRAVTRYCLPRSPL
jgi:MFS family permease